jgi:hypothetical protein
MDASRGTERARDVLRPQDVLAVLVAAMGHDVGHPGLSNAFMVCPTKPIQLTSEKRQNSPLPSVRRQIRLGEHALHADRATPSQTWLWLPHWSRARRRARLEGFQDRPAFRYSRNRHELTFR